MGAVCVLHCRLGSSIVVVDADGGRRTLVEGGAPDRSPAWQPLLP
jgi:hypothetical protein